MKQHITYKKASILIHFHKNFQSVLIGITLCFISYGLNGQGIRIQSGTTLVQNGGWLLVDGNWINNGALNATGGTVMFIGASQSISGNILNTFNNLTIQAGSSVNIPPDVNVTVNGTLTNNEGNDGLLLLSDTSGTGSLIHNTALVPATMHRHLYANRWHIISTPVSGTNVNDFINDGFNAIPISGSNYGMLTYSEAGGGWVYYTNPPVSDPIVVGTGYLLRHTTDSTVRTLGNLNVAQTDIAITQAANGWNCIGNPFPCSIGVRTDALSTQNFIDYNALELDPSFAVLYVWDEPVTRVSGVSYYRVISNAGYSISKPIIDQAYMQPGQGFLVKSKTGGGTVSFTPNMRLHENTGSYLKSARVPWPGMNLVVKNSSKSASTAITFNYKMTLGLDITYDAGLFGGDPNFQLYSRLAYDNGNNFMLQCLPDRDFSSVTIPLGLVNKTGGEVTFQPDDIVLPYGISAYFYDELTQMSTQLTSVNDKYIATVNANTNGTGRFFLKLVNTTTNYENLNNPFIIYGFQNNIIVNGDVTFNSKAYLYDNSGKLVKMYELKSSNYNILPASELKAGAYILKLIDKNTVQSAKVILGL